MDQAVELVVYRSTVKKYARSLDGTGAAKGAHNRWNALGQYVTYAAASRALALLELRVHSAVGPPFDAVISVIRLTFESAQIHRIRAANLPSGWRDPYHVEPCQTLGSDWYTGNVDSQLLIVPSVIVPAEEIFVIRGGAHGAAIVDVEPIEFDLRLWESERIE